MPSPFLTARWEHLALISYVVDDALLLPRLPPGLELDRFEGRACVSLVAFMFRETRLRGRRIPGHVCFPEVNLRFYVRSGDRRGVMFVREIVNRRAIATVARAVYNEPYVTRPLHANIREHEGRLEVMYRVRDHGEHLIGVNASAATVLPDERSPEYWFKEHQWGFGVDRRGRALTYEVRHPAWRTYPEARLHIDLDWGLLYGPAWGVLQDAEPISVVLAEGSAVEVFPKATGP
ncbi:MAG: DUF2071 domain-containing protein [Phycisphaerales bacterium JB059]